jgi:hypothetical protein
MYQFCTYFLRICTLLAAILSHIGTKLVLTVPISLVLTYRLVPTMPKRVALVPVTHLFLLSEAQKENNPRTRLCLERPCQKSAC